MQTLFPDTELFTSGALYKKVFEIPDAELVLWEHFFPRQEADACYAQLLRETPWKQEPFTIHGKTMPTPRLTAWFGKRTSGKPPLPLTPMLQRIREKVETQCQVSFTSVLLNLYRDGQDSVAWHRDKGKRIWRQSCDWLGQFWRDPPF
jgi:alkylated DNA repair dioxygenase AlkB